MKFLTGVIMLLGILFASSVSAATFKTGEEVTIGGEGAIVGDAYIAGSSVGITTPVRGDVFVAGRTISIAKDIAQDAMLIGDEISILGDVLGDLRVGGRTIRIEGDVGEDVLAGGQTISIGGDSVVQGDVFIGAQLATIEGKIQGSTEIGAGTLIIRGTLNGPVVVDVDKEIRITDGAVLDQGLTYTSPQEVIVSQGAVINGEVIRSEKSNVKKISVSKKLVPFFRALFVIKIVIMIVSGLIIFFVFKKLTKKVNERARTSFWKELLRGLIIIVFTPIISLVLLGTVVASPIGVILLLVWFMLIALSMVYLPIVLGHLVVSWLQKEKNYSNSWWIVLVGASVLIALGFIPKIGALIILVLFLAVAGSISGTRYMELWGKEK